ncbi:MAG: GyrI-like domain-containing protein [Bacteroidia bacterium]|nr:GyrI-like domain-containing protein [Bacteroidia bacterium]
MKYFKYTLLTLISILVILILVSFFLPNENSIERSIQINAKPSNVFTPINNLKLWTNWSPWHHLDTNTQYTYNEIETGKGAKYIWKSNHFEVGNGTLTIENAALDSFVDIVLEMNNAGKGYARFLLTPNDSGTFVKWSFYKSSKDMPFFMVPFAKLMLPFMDKFIGTNFENGLKYLKKHVESNPKIAIGNFEGEIRDFSGLNYIGIRSKIKGSEIGNTLDQYFKTLLEELKKKNIQCTGNPFTINYFAKGDTFDIMAAIPCSEPNSYNSPIVSSALPANKWLVIKYYGSYDKIGATYSQGFEYLAHQNYKPVGAPMEFYFTDPKTEQDTSKWYTEIVFPFME